MDDNFLHQSRQCEYCGKNNEIVPSGCVEVAMPTRIVTGGLGLRVSPLACCAFVGSFLQGCRNWNGASWSFQNSRGSCVEPMMAVK